MTDWLAEHIWITFVLIYACLAFVYVKVFKIRRLPILKELIIYLLIGAGAFLLLVFQIDLRLPIVPSMLAAVALMLVVRIRTYFLNRARKHANKEEDRA